jgi:hypothetical protein
MAEGRDQVVGKMEIERERWMGGYRELERDEER